MVMAVLVSSAEEEEAQYIWEYMVYLEWGIKYLICISKATN